MKSGSNSVRIPKIYNIDFLCSSHASLSTQLLVPLLLLAMLLPTAAQDLVVLATDTSINTVTNYTLLVPYLMYNMPAGSTLALTFPSEYSAATLHNMAPYSSYDASLGDYCFIDASCSVSISVSGRTLFLNGLINHDIDSSILGFFMQLTLFNIKNPDSLSTGQFYMTIFKGSTIYYPTAAGSSVSGPTFTPSIMPYSTHLATNSLWVTSALQITLTPDTLIDSLQLAFPTRWINETVSSVVKIDSPICTSATNPTIRCTPVGNTLFVSQLGYYQASTTIEINIHSIYNPSSLVGIGSITASGIFSGMQVTTATIDIPSSSFAPDILRQVTSDASYQAGDTLQVTISFSIPHISMPNDRVELVFPADFTMSTVASDYSISGPYTTSPVLTFYGNNSLTFQPFSILSISKASLTIQISNLRRPRECKSTNNFTISTFRQAQYLMELSSCCSIRLPNRQTLLSAPVQLSSSQRLNAGVTYIFNLTTVLVDLQTTDYIVIDFPSEYSSQIITSSQAAICSGVSIAALNYPGNLQAASCSVTTSSLRLSNFLQSSLGGPQTLLVTVTGVTNPDKTPGSGFGLATKSANGYVLQEISGLTITISANTLTSLTVSSDSLVTNRQNANYTFGVGNNAPLQNGYTLRIDFPADIVFINYATITCSVALLPMPCSKLDSLYASSTQVVLIFINQTVNTVGSVVISGITNPATTATTGAFAASIIDATETVVESSSGGPTITMSSPGTFKAVLVNSYDLGGGVNSRQSIMEVLNNEISVSLLLVTPFSTQLSAMSMLLTLSNSSAASYSAATGCSSSQLTLTCSFSTDMSTNILVTIPAITLASSNIDYLSFQIDNLVISNPNTLSLTVELRSNGNSALAMTLPVATSLYAEGVTNYSVLQTDHTLGASSDLSIVIDLSAKAQASAHTIRVYIPMEYTVPNYMIDIGIAAYVDNSVSISNVINPTTQQYGCFLFEVYDINGNVIAYSLPTSNQAYTFTLACQLPCKQCTTNTSECTSCYTNIPWILQRYFSNSSSTCVATCPDDHYLSNNTCFPCDQNCLTCLTYGPNYTDGSSDTCLTCNTSAFLLSNKCYETCPDGYYPSSPICSPCMSNCLTCSSYGSCLSCGPTLRLYSNQCVEACPMGYSAVTDAATNASSCVGCPSNCLQCSDNSTCVNCKGGWYLSGGSCVSGCSGALLPNYELECVACQCLSCSGFAYNCTSCANPLALFNSQCLSRCPTGYYRASNQCSQCMSNCSACSSANYCSICQLPNVLLISSPSASQCLATCPNGTIPTINAANFSYLCAACTNNCLSCLFVTDYCTSCSSPFVLSNHTCAGSCPPGQFNYSNECVFCYPQCSSCDSSNPSVCFTCSGGYYLSGTACLSSCPNTTYPNISHLYCATCSANCQTCENSSHCTSCVPTYFLYRNICYLDCSSMDPSLYSFNGSCLPCQPQCSSCFPSSPFDCVGCSNSEYYYNPTTKACTINCTTPYYANGAQCIPCELPCLTCDTAYNSCLTCSGGLVGYKGQCLNGCPSSYKNQSGMCTSCGTHCLVCDAIGCTLCQSYAYTYRNECVLDCSLYSDLPITVDNYCTNCQGIPYCQECQESAGPGYSCFACVSPYVVFNGGCLNNCPDYYSADSNRVCQQTAAYLEAQNLLFQKNKPKLPPFFFLILLVLAGLLLTLIAHRKYVYTYHFGHLLALAALIDTLCLLYGVYYIATLYEGDYTYSNQSLPLYILATSFLVKLLFSLVFLAVVVSQFYVKDVRYREWRDQNRLAFYLMIVLVLLFGPRLHKLFYSKLWALPALSFRIVSVQKFYREDFLNWLLMLSDMTDLAAFVIVAYNIFITYAVLYVLPFELVGIKVIVWVLFLYDLRKPDRGFFLGDEAEAALQIQQEQQLLQKKHNKFQLQNLAKLIRCQSAGHLRYERLYEFIFFDDTRSVYNPSDYEDPPRVPNKKILKNIERGRFRKGKKISIEQKLRRFADSIKPPPEPKQDNTYLKNLIYWKPPKLTKVKPKPQPKETEQSMLNLLRDKELYYESELREAEIEELDDDSEVARDYHQRKKVKSRLVFDADQETIGHRTFYEPTSIEHLDADDDDINGLMNRNYARKQHLPNRQLHAYDEHDLRILRHSPLKKRSYRSRLNELSIRRG